MYDCGFLSSHSLIHRRKNELSVSSLCSRHWARPAADNKQTAIRILARKPSRIVALSTRINLKIHDTCQVIILPEQLLPVT